MFLHPLSRRTRATQPHAVLFDFFGTLTRAVRRGAEHVRVAQALGVDPGDFGVLLGETFRARAAGRFGGMPETMRALAARLGTTVSDRQVEEACAARFALLRHDAVLRTDAVATVARLRSAGIKVAVVSDCTNELPTVWPTLPISTYFQAAVFSFELGVCKPDPRMYATACAALRVRPEECLYVGDGDSTELTGALRAGLRPLRLAAPDSAGHLSYNPEPDWRGPTIASLGEVLAHCEL